MTIFDLIKMAAAVLSLTGVVVLFAVVVGSSATLMFIFVYSFAVLITLSILFWVVYAAVSLGTYIKEYKRGGR